jgi:hypothetical protein
LGIFNIIIGFGVNLRKNQNMDFMIIVVGVGVWKGHIGYIASKWQMNRTY